LTRGINILRAAAAIAIIIEMKAFYLVVV